MAAELKRLVFDGRPDLNSRCLSKRGNTAMAFPVSLC